MRYEIDGQRVPADRQPGLASRPQETRGGAAGARMGSHWVTHTARSNSDNIRPPGRAQVNSRRQKRYAHVPEIEIGGYLSRRRRPSGAGYHRPNGRVPRITAIRAAGLPAATQSAVVVNGSSAAECSASRPASRRSIFATMSSQER